MEGAARIAGIVVRRAPFTLCGFVALLVIAAATGTLLSDPEDKPWYPDIAYGLPSFEAGRWWTPATGAVFAISAVGVAVVFAAMVGFAEFRMGTWRSIVAFAAGQVVGVVGAAAVLAVLRGHGWLWADVTAAAVDVGSSAGSMGALAASTATLSAPWRGRLRFVLVMYCLVALLHVGMLWDLEHGLAVALGLPLGPILIGRAPRLPSGRMGRREWRLLAAGATFFVAAGALVGALLPGNGPLGDPAAEPDLPELGVHGALVVLLLLLLADGLRRGRRVAWRWMLVIAAVIVLIAALPPYTPDSISTGLLAAGLIVILVAGRHAFTARGNAQIGRGVWLLLGMVFAALMIYAAIGFSVISGFEPQANFWLAVDELAARMFAEPGDLQPTTTTATIFLGSLTFLWWAFVISALVLVLWSNRVPTAGRERDRAIALLREHGGANLAWMITWPENAYWFSADGAAVVAYRVRAGVALGLCDPVCPADRLTETLRAFADFAEEHGWTACLFTVTQAVADASTDLSWKALQVAEEAVVPLRGLEFKGKKWQDVRTAINRAKKEGVRFELGHLAEMPYTTVRKVQAISEQWVADKGLPEMGFTLGGVDEALDPEVRVGLAVKDDGTVEGVTSWLPIIAPGGLVVGWTLDVMRRREGGFRPVTDFLLASACAAFRDEGALRASLSGAPLARAAGEEADVPALERALDTVGEAMEPLYGFRSLHAFKAKFQPQYAPMFLVYPDEAALPRIGLAIGRAYLPDGFAAVLTHR